MKKAFLIGVGLTAIASLAFAQAVAIPYVTSLAATDISQVIKGGAPQAGNVYASMLQLQAWMFSGNSQRTGATAPALTCGTGSPSIVGNDYAGTVTTGTSTTSCAITFNTAYVAAPHCVVTDESQITSFAYAVTTTAITVTQTSTSGNLIDYVCVAKPGG